jgi:hypothetical protein
MSAPGSATMLKAAGLWRKESAKGNTYWAGRLGGVKILILENRDRQDENEPSHHLFFVEGTSRPAAGSPPAPRQSASRRSSRRSLYRAPRPGDTAPLPDDRVDDLWPNGGAP